MIIALVLLAGLIIGSFLNVCIVRLPHGQSIATPPSQCPRCRKPIKFYDNIPVLSYLLLRGKCRTCGLPISWRYPLVELLNALVYLWVYRELGLNGEAVLVMALCSSLIVITFIDLDHQIIPDVITLPGMVLGLIVAPFFMPALSGPAPFYLDRLMPLDWPHLERVINSLIGLVCGGAPLFILGWVWEKLRHVEAMGGGDVKLMGMFGSFLGWKSALLIIMLGAIAGSFVGVALILLRKHKAENVIPFGPFLAAGALVTMLYGSDILSWYLGLLRI
jgi:leader peptidase (prepilin peptidase)/N-methyltransferase